MYLNPQHFSIVGQRQKTLSIKVPGPVLVMYKTQNCPHCRTLEPIFVRLSQKDRNVKYGICDLSAGREIIGWSRSTTTPIQNVPHILFYFNGMPVARYKGERSEMNILSFISKMMRQLPSTPPPQQQVQNGPNNNFMQNSNYNAPPQDQKIYKPEFGATPSMKKGNAGGYQLLGGVDEEDDNKLLIPDDVTPYNTPWATYKTMGTLD